LNEPNSMAGWWGGLVVGQRPKQTNRQKKIHTWLRNGIQFVRFQRKPTAQLGPSSKFWLCLPRLFDNYWIFLCFPPSPIYLQFIHRRFCLSVDDLSWSPVGWGNCLLFSGFINRIMDWDQTFDWITLGGILFHWRWL